MEALAAIIAHELRAGVLGVTSAAQLLRYSVPQDPVAEKSLGRILQEAETLIAAGHEVILLAGFECARPESYAERGIAVHRFTYDWDDELFLAGSA